MSGLTRASPRQIPDLSARPNQTALSARGLPIFVIFFLISLIIPLIINLGPVRLSVYRIALLVMFVPAFVNWASGKAGRIRSIDILVWLMITWMAISSIYHFGVGESVETIGVLTLEHVGAFLLGRAYIRDAETFRRMCKFLVGMFLVLLPLGIFEALTTTNITLELWDKIGTVPPDVYKEPRLGLDRVQGPFDHPILFGVFAAPAVGVAAFVVAYHRGFIGTAFLTAAIFFTGFLSVSSGPIAALAVQIGLIMWHAIFRNVKSRWWILLAILAVQYVIIDVLSNRSPIVVAISYLALNVQTGIARVNIWYWGWINIFENPIFGVSPGGEWKRYWFMTSSFDMFWLIYALAYGLIAGIGHVGAPVVLVTQMIRKKIDNPRIRSYRLGWIISLIGVVMAGWMVHFWNAPLALYFFFLGSGVWFLDYSDDDQQGGELEVAAEPQNTSRYTRYAQGHRPTVTRR